jgi:hypothetical protein
MQREYVAVFNGSEPSGDEIVRSCVASSRQAAERRMRVTDGTSYTVMTRRQAEARGIPDYRERF